MIIRIVKESCKPAHLGVTTRRDCSRWEWLTAMAKEHSVTRTEILEGVLNYARNNTISVVMRGESNARFFKWREKHAVSNPQN